MGLKRCFKCLRDLPVEAFYRHRMMADGRLGKCAECTKRDVREHREKNVERLREYDRNRASLPHRVELRNRTGKVWTARHPDRKNAETKARRAHLAGKLSAPAGCEACGRSAVRLEKHHPDYAKPLLVVWLCKPCHAVADQVRRAIEKVS